MITMNLMDITWLIVLWAIQGGITAYLARKKGRNPFLWFLIGCFFGIFGILAIAFIKSVIPAKPVKLPEKPVSQIPHFLWYYLDEQTQPQGPMSTQALESAFRQGKIFLSSYVWREGMPEWQRFETICQEFNVSMSPA